MDTRKIKFIPIKFKVIFKIELPTPSIKNIIIPYQERGFHS